jgi:cell division protein FtsB
MAMLSQRRLVTVIGIVAVLALALSFGQLLLTQYEVGQRAEALKEDIAVLREQNAELERELKYRRSDEGIERLAREQLGWTKPGDTLVVVPAMPADGATDSGPRATARSRPPNWRRWISLITGQ